MSLYPSILIISSSVILFSGLFVFYRNPHLRSKSIFLFFCLITGILGVIETGFILSKNSENTRVWFLLYTFRPVVLSLFLHFSLIFSHRVVLLKRKIVPFLIYFPSVVFSLLDHMTGLITGRPVQASWGWSRSVDPNPALFAAFLWSFLLCAIIIILIRGYFIRTARKKEKKSVLKILFASVLIAPVAVTLELIEGFSGSGIPSLSIPVIAIASLIIALSLKGYTNCMITPETAAETILETMNDNLILLSENGFVTSVNRAVVKLLGYRKGELIGKHYSKIIHQNERFISGNFGKSMIEKVQITDYVTRIVTKAGKVIPVSVSVNRIPDKSGDVSGFVLIARDISSRMAMEEAVESEKEKFRVTLHCIGDGVIAADREGRIEILNRAAEFLTGWSGKNAVGKQFGEIFRIIDEKTGDRLANPVKKVIATGIAEEYENNILLEADDGSERSIAFSASPVRGKLGRLLGVAVVFRDITDRRKFFQEIVRVQKLDSIEVLAEGIAHDFKNILTVIQGNLSLAKINLPPNDPISEIITDAETASVRARDLTEQFQTFAKGGAPVKKISSIGTILKETMGFSLRGTGIKFHINICNDLWCVEADGGQMSQAISNITINAVQAMPYGGTIQAKLENVIVDKSDCLPILDGQYICMTIKDQGVGIDKEDIQKIFDPYYTTKRKGSGLGLAVTYGIVKKHDGHITVESEIGKGTVFRIYLPASDVRRQSGNNRQLEKIIEKVRRALVVDGNEETRSVSEKILDNSGFHTEISATVEGALDIFSEGVDLGIPFHVVIMDLDMAGEDSAEDILIKMINIDPLVKIIASGNCKTSGAEKKLIALKNVKILSKPLLSENLIDAVKYFFSPGNLKK